MLPSEKNLFFVEIIFLSNKKICGGNKRSFGIKMIKKLLGHEMRRSCELQQKNCLISFNALVRPLSQMLKQRLWYLGEHGTMVSILASGPSYPGFNSQYFQNF